MVILFTFCFTSAGMALASSLGKNCPSLRQENGIAFPEGGAEVFPPWIVNLPLRGLMNHFHPLLLVSLARVLPTQGRAAGFPADGKAPTSLHDPHLGK